MQRLALACVVLLLAALVIAQTAAPRFRGSPSASGLCLPDASRRALCRPRQVPPMRHDAGAGHSGPRGVPVGPRVESAHAQAAPAGRPRIQNQRSQDGAPVKRFEVVHEKLFHMFIVSQDLDFFLHDHPVMAEDGTFRYQANLPKAGMYRVLADYYPTGGTPQLTAKTIFVPGGAVAAAASGSRPGRKAHREHGCGVDHGAAGSAGGP